MGIISSDVNNAANYYIFNGHGDTVALKGSSSVIASYTYDAFGQELDGVDGVYNPFRYSGEYADVESGMIYLRARYYDPGLGRFISEDPIKDGVNWYVYCGGNPVNFVDPLGLAAKMTKSDYENNFLPQAREIYGNEELTFNYRENDNLVILDEWVDVDYDGGSETGRALLKAVITDKKTVQIKYNRIGNRINSGYKSDGGSLLTMNDWEASEDSYSKAERNATLVHELAHAYTDFKGLDKIVEQNTNITISKGYSEATAITVEQQFRKEMGYADRNTQGVGMIDGNAAYWPNSLQWYPEGTTARAFSAQYSNRGSVISLMESIFIDYDIRQKFGR